MLKMLDIKEAFFIRNQADCKLAIYNLHIISIDRNNCKVSADAFHVSEYILLSIGSLRLTLILFM